MAYAINLLQTLRCGEREPRNWCDIAPKGAASLAFAFDEFCDRVDGLLENMHRPGLELPAPQGPRLASYACGIHIDAARP
jgi:hypothetical protein